MHPSSDQLDAYIARTLDRSARKQVDHHLTTCLRCTLRLETGASDPARWERRGLLQRLVPSLPVAAPTPAAAEQQPRAAA